VPRVQVEARERLVEEQDLGTRSERDREAHLGLLAAREPTREGMGRYREVVEQAEREGTVEVGTQREPRPDVDQGRLA
jgi:hypothetical protein